MLEPEPDIKVVGEASNAGEAISQSEALSPDVILMDIKMPGVDGIKLTRELKKKESSPHIIMLTLYDEYLSQAIEAGATGYLLKDIKHDELVRAIRAVREGRSPLNLSLSQEQLTEIVSPIDGQEQARLSERERIILKLIADGVTTKATAAPLFLSEASVKRSVRFIFEKLGVHNRSEAVSEAYKRRLI
jgi:DNA-binding NarL/FixJ family response regulator